jgi:glutathione S-transferase
MFLLEKSFDLEIVEMELYKENRTPKFRLKNPMENLPVLELDDGTCIAESIAICRYIEEISPVPRLFGGNPEEIAVIEMWNRRAKFAFYMPIEFAGGFMGSDVADGARKRVEKTMRLFDSQLASSTFIAGEVVSVADITTKAALDFGMQFNGISIPDDVPHFSRWNICMDNRKSAAA